MKLWQKIAGCVLIVFCVGCNSNQEKEQQTKQISIGGVEVLSPLMHHWVDAYSLQNKHIDFSILNQGHEIALMDFIEGKINMFITQHPLSHAERGIVNSSGRILLESVGAKDGLAIIVKNTSTCEILRPEQIKSIFTGEIDNWQDITGFDHPIEIITNPLQTYELFRFKKTMLDNLPMASTMLSLNTNEAVINQIKENDNAIALVNIADAIKSTRFVKTVSIVNKKEEPIPPTEFFVKYDGYPLSHSIYIYHDENLSLVEKEFLQFCLSPDGQSKLLRIGMMPTATKI